MKNSQKIVSLEKAQMYLSTFFASKLRSLRRLLLSFENDLSTAAFEQTAFCNLATRCGRIISSNNGNIQTVKIDLCHYLLFFKPTIFVGGEKL